jgi:hypothetical protein
MAFKKSYAKKRYSPKKRRSYKKKKTFRAKRIGAKMIKRQQGRSFKATQTFQLQG